MEGRVLPIPTPSAGSAEERWQLGHRPGLDGLRGIAILLVMVDHAGIDLAKRAGAVGVTIFFVLSGFLITILLLEERAQRGRFSLGRFYWRRALRLLPALVVFLAVVTLVMYLAGRTDEIAGDVVPTLFYFMNWSTVAGNNPGLLSHTWSLSIEEQFYLVWPIALLGLLAVRPERERWIAGVLVGLALVAITLRALVWSWPEGYHRAYFGTDTRMDALAVGCLVAVAFSQRPIRVPAWLMVPLAGAIPLIVWTTNDASMATFGLAATALAAAGLVAGAAAGTGERVLGWRPLAWVGIVSYGLYLWHRPIMKAFTGSGMGGIAWSVVVMFALSIGIAWLSRRFVEQPFLRMKNRSFGSGGVRATTASVSPAADAPPGRPAGTRSRR